MEKLVLWTAGIVIGSTFVVYTAFLALCTAKKIMAETDIPWDMKAVCVVLLIVGWPADVLFNWTRGSWMFRERPRKWTFSSRVQLHMDKPEWSRRGSLARRWARILNAGDAGHIKQ